MSGNGVLVDSEGESLDSWRSVKVPVWGYHNALILQKILTLRGLEVLPAELRDVKTCFCGGAFTTAAIPSPAGDVRQCSTCGFVIGPQKTGLGHSFAWGTIALRATLR